MSKRKLLLLRSRRANATFQQQFCSKLQPSHEDHVVALISGLGSILEYSHP